MSEKLTKAFIVLRAALQEADIDPKITLTVKSYTDLHKLMQVLEQDLSYPLYHDGGAIGECPKFLGIKLKSE